MADIYIVVTSVERDGMSSGNAKVLGICVVDGYEPQITWNATVSMSSAAVVVNTAIKDAAIQAAADAGQTVGVTDDKTLFGGAVLL